MNFFDFEKATLRLKQQLGVTQDKQVAALLNLTDATWKMRKKRGQFPETEIYALAAKRPNLCLDLDYILTGQTEEQKAMLVATPEELPAIQAAYEQRKLDETRLGKGSAGKKPGMLETVKNAYNLGEQVGKFAGNAIMSVPDALMGKPTPLTPEEAELLEELLKKLRIAIKAGKKDGFLASVEAGFTALGLKSAS
jgi:hypothetical protein